METASITRELRNTANNAPRAIAPLVEAGVRDEISSNRRSRMWQTAEVLTAVDAFAARAIRT